MFGTEGVMVLYGGSGAVWGEGCVCVGDFSSLVYLEFGLWTLQVE